MHRAKRPYHKPNYRPAQRYRYTCRDYPRPPSLKCCARNILTVHRETLTQYCTLHFIEGGEGGLYSCSLATVLSCIDTSVRIVTKSPKVEPLLIFLHLSGPAQDQVWIVPAGNTHGVMNHSSLWPKTPLITSSTGQKICVNTNPQARVQRGKKIFRLNEVEFVTENILNMGTEYPVSVEIFFPKFTSMSDYCRKFQYPWQAQFNIAI